MTVSSSTNRASYSGNGTLTTFAYGFKIFDQDELTVILRASDGTETVQTITTNYTVTGVAAAGGGNVVFGTAPASGVTIVILRELDLDQGLDLVPNDPFPAQSLEDSLDKLTFMVQQHNEELGRTIKASRTNVLAGSEFTISAADRANKVFSFDGSGDLAVTQELGTFQGNWAASTVYKVRDLVKDTSTNNIFMVKTAHTSSGSQPITTNTDAAKWDLIVDAAAATTSASAAAASETAAETAETNAETAQAASEAAKDASVTAKDASVVAKDASVAAQAAAEAVYDSFDDRYLGAKSTGSGDPTVDNDGNALIDGALFFDTTNNVMKVYNLGTTAWLRTTPTSSDQTNINTLSAAAVLADMAILATDAIVADMAILGTDAIVADMAILATDAIVADMAILATDAIVADMAILGTADVVNDMNILGTADVVTDMNVLATADVVTDMNVLATADVVNDMNVLGTSATVTAMNLLGTSAVVEDMGLLGISTVISDMATLAGGGANPTLTSLGVTGTVAAGGLTVSDSAVISSTSGAASLLIAADTTDSAINRDAAIFFATNGTTQFVAGLDDTDLSWQVAQSTGLGTDVKLKINNNGDISFYEDTGTTAKFFWDASAESLGIGTSSPSEALTVASAGKIKASRSDNARSLFLFTDNNAATVESDTDPLLLKSADRIEFETGGANERMRIDSSGNVLVGGTTTNHQDGSSQEQFSYMSGSFLAVSRSEGTVAYLNRQSSDGEIMQFRKDGTTVGSIGTLGGVTYMNSGDVGFALDWGSDQIKPRQANGANRDAAIDLGASASRWKDLYLSGGVYLGGTGAANKLDDYEEGTWTPAFSGAATNTGASNSGSYVKVGTFVHCTFIIYQTALTGTGTATMTGLPFTCVNVSNASAFAVQDMGHLLNVVSTDNGRFRCVGNAATLEGVKSLGSTTFMNYNELYDGSGNLEIKGAFSYRST